MGTWIIQIQNDAEEVLDVPLENLKLKNRNHIIEYGSMYGKPDSKKNQNPEYSGEHDQEYTESQAVKKDLYEITAISLAVPTRI